MNFFSKFKKLTRLEQSFFGLPIVVAGAILPFSDPQFAVDSQLFWRLLWVLPAFFAARISGMAFNQLIDRKIDAKNPRTKDRLLPQGLITVWQASFLAWLCLGIFLICCFQINLLTAAFGGFAAVLLFIYSYLKRIHASCHLVLGMIHFLAPFMASIAVRGTWSLSAFFLALAAFASIVANDIFYSMQDLSFDRQEGLHSIPARFGEKKSLRIAQAFHALCIGSLVELGVMGSFWWGCYVIPIALSVYFLYYYQKAVSPVQKEPLFFLTTVLTSISLLLYVALGVFLWNVLS